MHITCSNTVLYKVRPLTYLASYYPTNPALQLIPHTRSTMVKGFVFEQVMAISSIAYTLTDATLLQLPTVMFWSVLTSSQAYWQALKHTDKLTSILTSSQAYWHAHSHIDKLARILTCLHAYWQARMHTDKLACILTCILMYWHAHTHTDKLAHMNYELKHILWIY